MTEPAISIVIPCHNYAQYLPDCLASVRQQQIDETLIEVIAIDDASTDGTWEVLQEVRDWPVLRTYQETTNKGYVYIYRLGMSLARGRTVVPLDADDLIVEPSALASQLAMLDAHPDTAFVHSAYVEIDGAGRTTKVRRPDRRSGVVSGPVAFRRLLRGNFVQHTGTMIRRSAYEAIGGYDERLRNSIDWDLWLRLAKRYDVAYLREPLYAYRIHGENMHQRVSRPGSHAQILKEVFSVIDSATSDQPRSLRRLAHAEAHAMTASFYFTEQRGAEAGVKLAQSVWTHPAVLLSSNFRQALARAVPALMGRRGYQWARSAYRRLR